MRPRRTIYLTKLNRDLDSRIDKGLHKPCIQANVILDKDAKLNKEELTSISLMMLSGELDTITTLRPNVQDRAAREIGKFFSVDQPLCDAHDDEKCEYIVALVRECLRYFCVLRLALPRATVRDITYEGVKISQGTVIFLNAWACNMDEDIWADPEVFRPERFLEKSDAPMFTYGIGRMCVGSILPNRELYLIFIRLLNSFRIEKSDEVGIHPVGGNADLTSLVAMPKRYRVRFVPRREKILRAELGVVTARELLDGPRCVR
ncbi:hypothetical protein LTR28_007356 [Elasticomyces elasticus]|nr:hypothetical protein LTR28_007356 [Elasticomyces elasticus]